jgi:hypothetical protein
MVKWGLILFLVVAVGAAVRSQAPSESSPSREIQHTASSSADARRPSATTSITHWVAVETLNRRSCPSTDCGIVGRLFYREGVAVRELGDGWARITDPYDASCFAGQSPYFELGDDRCTVANGVVDGRLAEWVSAEFLTASQPEDPGEGAVGTAALVARSDDYGLHGSAFVAAADSMIADALCTPQDFVDNGGFVRSTRHARGVYFIYCGGTRLDDRLYLRVATGEVFR